MIINSLYPVTSPNHQTHLEGMMLEMLDPTNQPPWLRHPWQAIFTSGNIEMMETNLINQSMERLEMRYPSSAL